MLGAPPPSNFRPTGKWRALPRGQVVILQVEEAVGYPQMPRRRWRDATPEDLADLIAVDMKHGRINVMSA